MELVKKNVSYRQGESTAAGCGDIYRTDLEEVLEASPFDDMIIRCDCCCEILRENFLLRSAHKSSSVSEYRKTSGVSPDSTLFI